MMFLGDGRRAFLEFLRNMTPQILFLTLALLTGSRIDFMKPQFDLQGFKNVIPFVMCLIIFIGSVVASMSTFIEATIVANKKLSKLVKKITSKKFKTLKLICLLIAAAWRHNRPVFFQTVLALVICEAVILCVFIMGIQAAAQNPFFKHG